jgi:hypothetical protein
LTITLGSEVTSKTVGPQGGTLDVTGTDGTRYDIDVPKDALDSAVTISATPVASLGDLGIDAHAIVLQPSGTVFALPVTITATPAKALPVDRQAMFMFSDDGAYVWAAEPQVDTKEIVFLTSHFTGFGFADLTKGERETSVQWTTKGAEAKLDSYINQILQQERERQLAGDLSESDTADVAITKAVDAYEKDVFETQVAKAGNSCAAAREAIATVMGFERKRALLGMQSRTSHTAGAPDTLGPLLALQWKPCEREAIEQCKKARDSSILVNFWVGANQEAQSFSVAKPFSTDNMTKRSQDICDPRSYEASGGLDEYHGTGTICSLDQPFTITGSGVTHTFTPTSDEGGTYRYTGSMSGFDVKGSGTYVVKLDGDGGSIAATSRGSVKTPLGWKSAGGTEEYTLTRIDPCE